MPAADAGLVGDVIFAGGIGRTDFPDGDFDSLIASIRRQLFTSSRRHPAAARPRPRHRRGDEKRGNPFVAE